MHCAQERRLNVEGIVQRRLADPAVPVKLRVILGCLVPLASGETMFIFVSTVEIIALMRQIRPYRLRRSTLNLFQGLHPAYIAN